ncbi:hypothetical protein [Microbacterium sp.]|uniref:hypothetical protein n=1 Tax=Microbacterium sp. TaxID=51671 RepID=UPI003A955AF7
MTTITQPVGSDGTRSGSRILKVVRMQLVNKMTYIWIPLIIFVSMVVITLAIFGIVRSAGGDVAMYGGGAQAPLWYFAVVGIQALTLTFPFAQAMSVTRREFFFGTLLTAAITSAILAAMFVIFGTIETATHGWGMDGWFFALPWIWASGVGAAALFYFVTAMLIFVAGFFGATVYKRFGSLGLTVTLVGLAVLLVAALWIVGRLNAWAPVFTWLAGLGTVGLSLWMLVLTVVLGAGAYGMLRRLVP